jgi:hypothetical protein
MSQVRVSGNASGTGVITVTSPNTNSNFTQTLPAETGTLLTTATPGVPVNGPAFSAYRSGTQTISANTFTKVTLDIEEFDTNNNYASSRFTPTVAGYYQISGAVSMTLSGTVITSIFKNGSEFKRLGFSSGITTIGGSYPIYFNGTTDYVELYVFSSLTDVNGTIFTTYFGGCLVRSAT